MMTPEYLRELADMVDYEELWRRPGLERLNGLMTPEQIKRLDAGVAIRRHAHHLEELIECAKRDKSLLLTPLSPTGNGVRVSFIATPRSHRK